MLLALLIAATPPGDSDSRLHVALAGGIGLAYAYAGFHAEVRWRVVSLFVAFTPFDLRGVVTQWPLSENLSMIAAGVRFIADGDSGLLISLNWTRARYQHHLDTGYSGSALDPAGHDTYTATIGRRIREGPFFFDVGIGGGVAHDFDHHGSGFDSFPGPLSRSTDPYFDVALAAGIEF